MVGSRASLAQGKYWGPLGWIPSPTADQAHLETLHILAEAGQSSVDGTGKWEAVGGR